MAESLNIKITATDSSAAAFASLNRNMNNVSGSFQRLSSTISGFTRGAVGAVLAGSIGEAIGSVVRYADTWTLMQNRLRSAGLTANQTAQAQTKIAEIASKSRSDLSETANLYARVAFATETMGVKQTDVARVTETLSMAFKMSGKTALEAQSAVTQFTQALSSGVLQGDELRSLRENAPEVARAIANAFGTSVGGLKQLGAEGKLTSDKIFQAILDAAPKIEARFATTQSTFADIFTKISNTVQIAIGSFQDLFKESKNIVIGLDELRKAQADLEDKTTLSAAAQAELNNGLKDIAVSDAYSNYYNLSKALNDTEKQATALVKAFQSQGNLFPEDFGNAFKGEVDAINSIRTQYIDVFNKALSSTGDEAVKAANELRRLNEENPEFAAGIASTIKMVEALVGLKIAASDAKKSVDQLRMPQDQGIGNIPLPPEAGISPLVGDRENFDKITKDYIKNRSEQIRATKLQLYTEEELNKARMSGAAAATQADAENLAKQRIAYEESLSSGKKYGDQINDLIQKYREAADPLLKYRDDLAFVEEAFKSGKISAAQYSETVANINLAMEKAAENADPLKKQTEELTRAFESFGRKSADAIADFVVDGKGNFSDLIKSMIKDMISFSIYQNLMKPLFGGGGTNFLSSIFSLGGGGRTTIAGNALGGLRASGGSVASGSPYVVGENGPELFVPNRSGSIVPDTSMSGNSGGVIVNQTINVSTGVQQTVRAEIQSLLPQISNAAKAAVIDAKRRGGSFANAFGG